MTLPFVTVHEGGGSELLPSLPGSLRVYLILREARGSGSHGSPDAKPIPTAP